MTDQPSDKPDSALETPSRLQRRRQRRLDTLAILDDPDWPGDGAEAPSFARAASWWFLGAAILLAFPRQYVAAIGAFLLAILCRQLHLRAKSKRDDQRSPPA